MSWMLLFLVVPPSCCCGDATCNIGGCNGVEVVGVEVAGTEEGFGCSRLFGLAAAGGSASSGACWAA